MQIINIKKLFENNYFIFIVIFFFLLGAHLPVITGDYLKQDDWNATFWNHNIISSHPAFYNALYELFRPISALLFLTSDFICYEVENAKFVRLFNIFLLSVGAFITYIWVAMLSIKSKLLALVFSVTVFCLPTYQLLSSTAVYNHMIIALICGQLSMLFFYKSLHNQNSIIKKYIIYSGILFLAGVLNYPPATMYFFVFLFIYFLFNINNKNIKIYDVYKFIFTATVFAIIIMIVYILLAKLVHLIFDISMAVHGGVIRSVHIEWSIYNKFIHLYAMFKASLGAINPFSYHKLILKNTPFDLFLFIFVLGLYLFTIFSIYFDDFRNKFSKIETLVRILFIILITIIFLILCYLPMLATNVEVPVHTTFRYLIATSPLILFIFLWSINHANLYSLNVFLNTSKVVILSVFLIFSIYRCNTNIKFHIVDPHLTEMNHIKNAMYNEISKNPKDFKNLTIVIIKNNQKRKLLFNDYDLRINITHNWLISSAIYNLRTFDIKTAPTHKVIKWDDNIIHIKSYWGDLLSVTSLDETNISEFNNLIIIDMNDINLD